MTKLTILMDADMLIYASSAAVEVETDWGNDIWSLHSNVGDAKDSFESSVKSIVTSVLRKTKHKGEHKIIMCLSDTTNFRYQVFPEYKGSRKGKRKPVCYKGLLKYVEETYECCRYPNLEGDDCLGYLATTLDNSIVVSGDKDLHGVPCRLYDHLKDEFYVITQEEADRFHLYQTLIGDTCDGYSGCPGVGKVTAEKILAKDCSWSAVVKTYESKGLTEADALIQARTAKILTKDEWSDTEGVLLWNPRAQDSYSN